MEVTMLTPRLSARHSIFAQLMELEVWPSTASSVLMVHSSTRTTSSVIGGSTLTAPLPRTSTLSMMKSLLSVKLLPELLLTLLITTKHPLTMLLPLLLPLLLLMNTLWREGGAGGWEEGGTTGEEEGGREGEVELTLLTHDGTCYP